MYILQWHTDLVNSSMYQTYRIFKNNFSCENYFRMLPYNCAISLARFRTTNNPLPVNVQRFINVEREDRICTLCDRREVGDEFHYLFNCQYFTAEARCEVEKSTWPAIQKQQHVYTRATTTTCLPCHQVSYFIVKKHHQPSFALHVHFICLHLVFYILEKKVVLFL